MFSISDDLVRAIANGYGVAYVGAGASMAAGLKGWSALIATVLEKVKSTTRNLSVTNEELKWMTDALDHGRLPELADVLQRVLQGSDELGRLLREYYRGGTPSRIHYAIARLPFHPFITTNYDKLLERAFELQGQAPSVEDWTDSKGLWATLNEGSDMAENSSVSNPESQTATNPHPVIVKAHGTYDSSRQVLTQQNYRDLENGAERFADYLRTLLATRTFLFIGHSLRDPDLRSLLGQLKVQFKWEKSTHYAILPEAEAPGRVVDYYKELFGIGVITYKGDHTTGVMEVLQEMSSRVAAKRVTSLQLAETFRRGQVEELAEQCRLHTGSFRVDVAFVPAEPGKYLVLDTCCGPTDKRSQERERIAHHSIMGATLVRRFSSDVVYLPDVTKPDAWDESFGGLRYVSCHPDVRSEMACPIEWEGQRVGVLNLESNIENAYGEGHALAARMYARRLGAAYGLAKVRNAGASRLRGWFSRPKAFVDLLKHHPRLATLHDLSIILYEADYNEGMLRPHGSVTPTGNPMPFSFTANSFAGRIFRNKKSEFVRVPSISEFVDKGGLYTWGINGPLLGVPLMVGEVMAAVLVAWSNENGQLLEVVRDTMERVANFGVNSDGELAKGFLTSLAASVDAQSLTSALAGLKWPEGEAVFRNVRHWVPSDNGSFQCQTAIRIDGLDTPHTWQLTTPNPPGHEPNPYSEFTRSRIGHDPLAQVYSKRLFGDEDPMATVVGRHADSEWIVGPIVCKDRNLLGFISVDCDPGPPGGERDSHSPVSISGGSKDFHYMLRAVDVVADLMAFVASGGAARAASGNQGD